MFYDLDILNRRGGKFGIIWLVANQKIRLKGKGSKKDLHLMLQVQVDRVCQDLVRYVRVENPAKFSGDPSPRFSLYLAAMLTHGAILVHHRQVSHTLAHFRLTFQQQKLEKKLKEANISCNVLDLTDVIVGTRENLLGDNLTLEEREFGQLVDVVDALGISTFRNSPPEVLPEAPVPRNLTTTVDEIEKDFTDFFKQTSQTPNENLVSSDNITLREFEPAMRTLPEFEDECFGFVHESIENIPEWGNKDLPPVIELMEIDGLKEGGQSNLQRSNSKRVHNDGSLQEDVPNKQSRIDQSGEPVGLSAGESNDMMEITLEPLQDSLNTARLRRPRRLNIDARTVIPAEEFQSRLKNYENTLRVTDVRGDIIIPQYVKSTANDMIRRPSVLNIQSSLSCLITRNMITRQVDDAAFDIPLTEKNRMDHNTRFERSVFGSARQISASPKIRVNEIHDEISMEPLPEQILNMDKNNPINDVNMDIIEKPRAGQSNEASLVGSLNASILTVRDTSGLDMSRTSPVERQTAKNPCMDTLVEASVENSRATKSSTVEDRNRPGIPNERTLVENVDPARSGRTLPSQPLAILRETVANDISSTLLVETEPLLPEHALRTSLDGQVAYGSPFVPITISGLEPSSSQSYSQVKVPEKEDLLNMIDALTDQISDTLTFKELVPPSSYSRIEAAKIFYRLLALKKEGRIDLHQEAFDALPYGDIHINYCKG